MKKFIPFFMVLGTLSIFAIVAVAWCFSTINSEIALRMQFSAQENAVETSMDTMRKKIINEYKVTREFADRFISVVQSQADGRKGGQGAMLSAKANTESSSLGIPPEVYLKMMNSISGNLSEFKEAQDRLTDIYRQHQTLCMSVPNNLLIGSKASLLKKPEMITSEISKEVIKTKKLNDDLI